MRTLGLPLINNQINLDLIWSKKCVIIATAVADQGVTFSITDTKRYVPVMTLSTWDNARLLEQLKSGFKRTINWNKYQSRYQQKDRTNISYKQYYPLTVEIKNFNVVFDG